MDHPHYEIPSRDAFIAAVNSHFNISVEGGDPVEFTLVECNSLLSNERQECYSLLFRGPAEQPAIQETYLLENDKLGKLKLLLVPVKRDENGLYFEAVMNHLLAR